MFHKIFLFMLIAFIVVVFSISYFIAKEQISGVEKNVVRKHKIIGGFLSKEIEVGYFESHWPFESLKKLSEYEGFLFWWIVNNEGVIHLADQASFMRTLAKDYFPEIALMQEQFISMNMDENRGIFFKPLSTGTKKWSFWYGFSLDEISARKREIIILIMSISMSFLLIVSTTLFFGIKYFIKPIKSLTVGASIIGGGDLTHRVKLESQDELGVLAHSFNKMADDLLKSYTALQESEGKFRELAELLPQPVFEIDVNGNFKYSNQSGLETFGYTRDDLEKGVNALQVFIPEERERVQQNIQKRLTGEDIDDHEYTGLKRDGSTFPILIYSAPITREGKAIGIRGIALDITERIVAEEALRESEEKYRRLFENASIGIGIANEKGEIIAFNDAMLKPGGYRREDILKINNIAELYYDPKERSKVLTIAQKQGFVDEIDMQFKRKDGTPYDAVLSLRPVQIKGKPCWQAIVQDISERKKVREALRKSEEQQRAIFKAAQDVSFIITDAKDPESFVLEFSPGAEKVFGYKRSEIVGKPVSILHLCEDVEKFPEAHQRMREGKTAFGGEATLVRKSGERFPALFTTYPLFDESGYMFAALCVSIDISERKLMELQLQESLKEKEILLREIHHRVKNNMQIISSLLELQSKHIKDKQEAELFKDSKDRIASMSLIHELLYQSEKLSNIDFGGYIQQLVYNLHRSFGLDVGKIKVNIKAKDVFIGIDVAIPLGLIINELVSNSFKYAFPAGQEGTISIKLKLADDDTVELIIGDNGIGIPESLDFRHSDTLGLQLVTNLTEHQLGGKIEIRSNGGTEFRIRFKVKRT